MSDKSAITLAYEEWSDVFAQRYQGEGYRIAFEAGATWAYARESSRIAELETVLSEAREDILNFKNSRWSECEGTDSDYVGYIDAVLSQEKQHD